MLDPITMKLGKERKGVQVNKVRKRRQVNKEFCELKNVEYRDAIKS